MSCFVPRFGRRVVAPLREKPADVPQAYNSPNLPVSYPHPKESGIGGVSLFVVKPLGEPTPISETPPAVGTLHQSASVNRGDKYNGYGRARFGT
jgi:hypothetical protein